MQNCDVSLWLILNWKQKPQMCFRPIFGIINIQIYLHAILEDNLVRILLCFLMTTLLID